MPTLIQINTTCNAGSHGRLAEYIGMSAMDHGYRSIIAYGQGPANSLSETIRIGNIANRYIHALETRLLDRHGLGSRYATIRLIKQIERISPDIIHLHNIHGYYLNYPLLFKALASLRIPVVWTLHDCWAMTGHCAHFISSGCHRWETGCYNCPQLSSYPASLAIDRSNSNYRDKLQSFALPERLEIVTVCKWQSGLISKSILRDRPITVIRNGIDTETFRPHSAAHSKGNKQILLGVANVWNQWKGLDDFVKLSRHLPNNYEIHLAGLPPRQCAGLPQNIKSIGRINHPYELTQVYSASDIFLNLSHDDTYPTTILESLSCGTPVITYDTGGCSEAIDSNTGIVVPSGDITSVLTAIERISQQSSIYYTSQNCRAFACRNHDRAINALSYLNLYKKILSGGTTPIHR